MTALRGREDVLTAIAELEDIGVLLQARTRSSDNEKIVNYVGRIIDGSRALATFIREKVVEDDFAAGPESATEESRERRHTLRNLLNRLSGPAQLLMSKLPDERNRSDLERMVELITQCANTLDVANSAGAPGSMMNSRSKQHPKGDGARILIAEDDEQNSAFLREVLHADDYVVEVVSDGVEALERVGRSEFDVILLDLGLPKINGFDVLERLQNEGWQTPVIVVTGRRGLEDAVRCIEHGADDFLTKPIQIELLRARVKSSVEKTRLREREFAQFFPPKLAGMFARRPDLINSLPSKHADVSVLFCDIRNFAAISERLGPEVTTRWLRAVMNELSEIIIANEGVLVDFAGDEIMAMWGAPEEIPDHAVRACNTAVEIVESLPKLSDTWRETIGSETDLAVGVNSGRAMVGHIGTDRKTKYGALGDPVNLGSRVLGATKYLRTKLLITGETRSALPGDWTKGATRRLCQVRVQNVEKPVSLVEVKPAAGAAPTGDLLERYEAALGHFEAQSFQQSSAILGQLLVDFPDDGPSLVLMSRVVDAMLSDNATFDPVWTLSGK